MGVIIGFERLLPAYDFIGYSSWKMNCDNKTKTDLTVYTNKCIYRIMNMVKVYKCLCDEQRLRILNLLRAGPLCVCHLMEILGADQVKISKQLRYMKELGMVEGERSAQWMVYRLAEPSHPLLEENLKCLQDCAGEAICFAEDSARRRELMARLNDGECGIPAVKALK